MNLLSHLVERHLDVNLYNGVYICDDVVIFTLWNLSGQMVGYQQYRPGASKQKKNSPREGRYYTSLHGNKNEKPLGVWGLESYHYRSDVLFITEGIFDSCRLHNLGLPSVALLSSSYKSYRNWLTSTGRAIIKVEDDRATNFGPYKSLILPTDRSDLGDCTDKELNEVLYDQFAYKGY